MLKRRSSNVNRSLEEELSIAVRKTNTSNTEALLDRGANPTLAYERYPVPFYASLPNLRLLLDRGMNADIQEDLHGRTLLNELCVEHMPGNTWQNGTDKIRLLLSRGADPNLADKNGETPLHSLCQKSLDVRILRLLLQHHANANQQDNDGNTVFHHIAKNVFIFSRPVKPYQEAIDLLLEAGADPLLRNEGGQTASEIARSNHRESPLIHELEEIERQNNSENHNQAMNGGRRRTGHKSLATRKSSATRKSTKKARIRRNKRTHKAR